MREWLKTTTGQIVYLGFTIALSVFGVFGFIRVVHHRHIVFVDQDIGKALDEARKKPAGIARGEEFLRRLKAIDTSYVPPELKRALSDYIEADERALIAIEAGGDASAHEKAMVEAKQRILAIEEKYR